MRSSSIPRSKSSSPSPSSSSAANNTRPRDASLLLTCGGRDVLAGLGEVAKNNIRSAASLALGSPAAPTAAGAGTCRDDDDVVLKLESGLRTFVALGAAARAVEGRGLRRAAIAIDERGLFIAAIAIDARGLLCILAMDVLGDRPCSSRDVSVAAALRSTSFESTSSGPSSSSVSSPLRGREAAVVAGAFPFPFDFDALV